MADGDRWRCGLYLVQEELEVTNDHELADPTFLYPTGLGHFNIAFVSCPNPTGRVNSERSFGWKIKPQVTHKIELQ